MGRTIPAAGRLSQAVAASFSTPAPPEAKHRGVAAAAAAAALQMKGGRERRIKSEMERTVVAGVDRLNASHGALSRLLMVPDPLALADLGGACSSGGADGPWQRRRQSDYHYNQTKPMLLLLLRQAASEQVEVLPAPGQEHGAVGEYLAQNMITAFLEHHKMKSWIQAGRET
uniref:Uncharacterized protein n=1 Tax=Oryza barthii TaxID=65489 RepID=A0A0D3EIV6_9ORYZ